MEPGQPADTFQTVIEGIFGQGIQLIELVVEGAEGHDAVDGHVLGLVCMGRDLGLGLLTLCGGRGVVVDLREDVIQRCLVPEHEGGLVVQGIDDPRVGRAKVLGRPREVRGAPEQAEVQFVTVLRDGGQIDSGAMGRPGLGGLREGLERVLRTDPVEVVGVGAEKAPVVHADAVYSDGNLAEVYQRPRLAMTLVVTV
ncbi:hypothetical protein GCM10027290_40840 [Micromonospora sonneratiae]|uniref:Uncharacterized protein n=1 Tax=Micromonospora sonneratiae TaxID=1184706 RepID=A0ABW3YPS5_9ACTN